MALVNSFIEILHGQPPKSVTEYDHSVAGLAKYLNDHGVQHTSGTEMASCKNPKLAKELLGTQYVLPELTHWPFSLALALVFDQIRDAVGAPAWITSHYRPTILNEKVGGAPRSDHIFARALDIHFASSTHRKAGQRLVESKFYGFTELGVGLGVGQTMIHVSIFSPHGRRRWAYSSLKEEGVG